MDTDDPELVGLDEEFLGKIFYDKDNKTCGGAWFVIGSVVWIPKYGKLSAISIKPRNDNTRMKRTEAAGKTTPLEKEPPN